MFNPLNYLGLGKPAEPPVDASKVEEMEQISAEIEKKMTEFHRSAREFEATAKEFLEDKDDFEGRRRGKY
jgi:hypothetical protein